MSEDKNIKLARLIGLEKKARDARSKDELNFVIKILSKFNYKSSFQSPINKSKQIRHIFYTVKDHNKFMEFEKISKRHNIIGGGWHLMSSQRKMDYIKNKIDKLDL